MLQSSPPRLWWLAAFAAAVVATATAQGDLRDVVTLKTGKTVTGRVVAPFAPGPLLVVQGGKRVRIERADVAEMDLLASRIAEFLRQRKKLAGKSAAQAILIEWADAHGLPNLAQLHAMHVCLASEDEHAHHRLGHRQRGGQWLWPPGERWLSAAQLEQALSQDPITLSGERFRLRLDGNLRAGVAALFDLERLGVFWRDAFGEALQLDEVLQPIDVNVTYAVADFAKWGYRPLPYYVPAPHGDVARTFFASPAQARPQRLFFVGTQALLYRTLIGQSNARDDRDRTCAWLEIGLPMFAELTMQGDAGFAEPGEVRTQDLHAAQTMTREVDLARLLHQPMYGGYYLLDDAPTQTLWSTAAMFTQFLLREDNLPDTRVRFLAYVRSALGDKRGDSSTLFDKDMGKRIEEFEAPFRAWLQKVAAR